MPTAEHNCNEITQRIMAAFAEVPWPYGSAVHINTPEEAMAELEDILLRSDEAMKYMLPRIMCVAVTAAKPPLLERLLSRLLEFLDVDFYDPEGTNNPLKQAKLRMFSGYTPAQAKAVWRWLKYVQAHFGLTDCQDYVASALQYWNGKSNPPVSKGTGERRIGS